MRKSVFLLPCLAFAAVSAAASDVMFQKPPEDWLVFQSHRGNSYSAAPDHLSAIEGSACALLRSQAASERQFGTLMQAIKADQYRGKRVRLSAQLQSENAHKAWLWMRADREDSVDVAFDNRHERPIVGTTRWALENVVLDIPNDAVAMAYGVGLRGSGEVWIDAMNLDFER